MPLGINNPFPTTAGGECKKASKVNLGPILIFSLRANLIRQQQVLSSFIDPRQAFGPDKIIPPSVLANAKVRRFNDTEFLLSSLGLGIIEPLSYRIIRG